jgi:hypothetical protein
MAPPAVTLLELPAPCAGIAYREELQPVEPGPHTWSQASEPPEGLRFDPETGILSGVPRAGGRLQVTSSTGSSETRIDIDLALRDSCWFALLSQSTPAEPPQLHLRDVFLTQDTVLGGGEAVRDFAFSPDGAWLAFRAGSELSQQLFLYAIPAEPDGVLPAMALPAAFDCASAPASGQCSVLEYAWSPDSRRLAVALRSSEGNDAVSVLDAAGATASLPLFTVDGFGTPQELRFAGQLTWGGADWFGFWGLEAGVPAEESQVFHLATLDAGKPALSALLAEFGAGPRLRSIPTGLALSYADSTVITALGKSAGAAPITLRRAPGVLSPSGRYVATASDEGRLQLRELLTEQSGETASPLESARDSCGAIVAWSAQLEPGSERILCTQGTRLRSFEVVSAAPFAGGARLEPEAGVELGATPNLLATRRMFSATGRFLLLADASTRQLSLLDLLLGKADDGLPFEWPAVMEFALTRDTLALASGESWAEYGLPRSLGLQRTYSTSADAVGGAIGGATPAPGALCSESFWQDPERWCGAPAVAAHWQYSPRSQSLLLEGPQGQLTIADLSLMPQRDARPLDGALQPCASPCRATRYAFRPGASPTAQ